MGPMNRYQHITSENTRHMIDTLAAEMQEKGIKPEMEVFNNGHMNEVHRLIDKGLLEEPYYINIIFGPGTLTPPTPENMVNMVNNLPDNSIFNVLAIGRHQLPLTTMGIVMGGHVRVGMEDNLYYRRGEPAESNAQLVGRTVRIADELDRELATPAEARELLGIPA
jgi:3-keto-5-aminohexanoate cleavage enzyme